MIEITSELVEQTGLLNAEQAVLGGILINPVVAGDVFEIVGPADFLTSSHMAIAEAAYSLYSKTEQPDIVSVAEELARTEKLEEAGGPKYLAELAEGTPGTSNVRSWAKLVSDHSHRRAMLNALDEASKAVYAAPLKPMDEVISSCQSALSELEKSRDSGAGPQQLDAAAKEVLSDWQTLDRGEVVPRVHSGWSAIDQRWKGLRGGELMVLAGTPGTGKTVVAVQIATHAALNGQRALVFSLEMSRRELYRRMVGMVGRCPVGLLDSDLAEDRHRFHESHSDSLAYAVTKLRNIAMEVDDQGALHINQIVSRARRSHRKSPLSLIVVDYLQIARGDGQSREREVASISAGLKALAKELDVPVIALSQFNREAQKGGRPSVGQLRDSGAIEQDADYVVLLHRPEHANQDMDTVTPGLVEVITAKMRRGQPGMDLLKAKLSEFRMEEWSGEVMEMQSENKARRYFEV